MEYVTFINNYLYEFQDSSVNVTNKQTCTRFIFFVFNFF